MKNSEEFRRVFNKIENYLNKLVNKPVYSRFSNLINLASEKNRAVKEYANDLMEFAELRNAIVHAKNEKIIAEVFKSTIRDLKKIYQQIKNPPLSCEIASKPVYTCQIKDSLLEQIKIMREKTYTHVPVYKNTDFRGVLSESALFSWLGDLGKIDTINKDIKVGDIQKYLNIEGRSNEYFKLIDKKTNIYKVKQLFEQNIEKNKRLGAVFITKSGKGNKKIIGIITAWDLPRIKEVK